MEENHDSFDVFCIVVKEYFGSPLRLPGVFTFFWAVSFLKKKKNTKEPSVRA